ncbi:MAG: uracil-DNA glycosylase [Cryomorphaceae bacterium]|nr:MAG: uracil-DNA glycosylase [Cryomorphaceae bacterium]
MQVRLHPSWASRLKGEFRKPYFTSLVDFVKTEYRQHTVYPSGKHIFLALDSCEFEAVRVVVLGQDPYHGPGQAHGLCFSVPEGIGLPPSLVNIYKELESDLGCPRPVSGNLSCWAEQGVLLLNATLTVRAHQAGSHQGKGWEEFTDAVINTLAGEREKIVFMLWGSYAQRKGRMIDRQRHLVLEAPHPSPLSAHRGFFGCRHFSQANSYLQENGHAPIRWC